MRSNLVSLANGLVHNRFLLCQMTSEGARTLHRNSASVHQTINDVLQLIGDGKMTEATPATAAARAAAKTAASVGAPPEEKAVVGV